MTRLPVELTSFHRSLARINHTRARMERLYREGRITKTDLDSVYEALFLRVVTSFESFLENLFLAILEKRTRYRNGRVLLKMKTDSRDELMEILLQGDKYMTWLPFYNRENRAKIYLKDGRPFTELDNGAKSTIKTITTIRNAIAHKSPHAMNEFRRHVIGSLPLLRGERSAAGFLRSQTRSGTDVRFEVYMGELGKMALALC
jgi:hypothetical protein